MISDDTFVLIAQRNGDAAGYTWFELQNRRPTPFTSSRSQTDAHHIVVRNDARSAGIASALLNAAEQEARARGIGQPALDRWTFIKAQRFFQTAGFVPSKIVLRKRVE